MSEPKPYMLSYFLGPKPPAISEPICKTEPLQYRERKYFDAEEEAVAHAEKLMISGQGHGFFLYNDEKELRRDLDCDLVRRAFRRRKWPADD